MQQERAAATAMAAVKLLTSQPAARHTSRRLAQQQVIVASAVEEQRHSGCAAVLPVAVAANLLQAGVVQHVDSDRPAQHVCRHCQRGLACVRLEVTERRSEGLKCRCLGSEEPAAKMRSPWPSQSDLSLQQPSAPPQVCGCRMHAK